MYKQNWALNNRQKLTCHKTQPTNWQQTNSPLFLFLNLIFTILISSYFDWFENFYIEFQL